MNDITAEKALDLDVTFIDVRSPNEFEEDHIPGAINLPILDNQERHDVGTLYKEDKERAFDLAIDHYGKKLPEMVKSIRSLDRSKSIVVYCWRGGMRSKAVSQLVDLLGFQSLKIEGGYKAYRKQVRESLSTYKPPFQFIVLQGLTGSGKTDLIVDLPSSLDLEGLAQHRSSRFGAISKKPRSQKFFESMLYAKLQELKDEKIVFVEGEARKIGPILIPINLFQSMQEGVTVDITAPTDLRAKRIVRDYFSHGLDKEIKQIIQGMNKVISKKQLEAYVELLDNKNYEELSRRLLVEFYDSQYLHAVKNISFKKVFNHSITENTVNDLIDFRNTQLKDKNL